MGHYECRSWAGWHHHMTLVALAHLLVTGVRQRLQKKTSSLTLDMAVRLLKAARPRPELTVEAALTIVEYHLRRKEVARRSHAKTWTQRNKGVKLTPLFNTKEASLPG